MIAIFKGLIPYRAQKREPRVSGTPFSKWAEGELNPRHQDFQSCALPTELSARKSVLQWNPEQNTSIRTIDYQRTDLRRADVRDSFAALQDFEHLLSNFRTQDTQNRFDPAAFPQENILGDN